MTTVEEIKLTSAELGLLWMSYIPISARISVHGIFGGKSIDKGAQSIFKSYNIDVQNLKNEIAKILTNEKVIIPFGFDERDITPEAPPVFDDVFNIMFLRRMMKLNFGHDGVFIGMTYMKEVNNYFESNYLICNKYYMMATNYLLRKGVIALPPFVPMPKKVKFIQDKNYMSGINIFSPKRLLNTVEIGYIHEAMESSIFNMKLLKGFAQVATDSKVKKYFIEGMDLSNRIISKLSDILLQSDIQPPNFWNGKVTNSTESPFSDKLMMYINSLIASTPLGFTALGASFNMRIDLPLKLAFISKDTFEYAKKGAKIMIKHKWMEEPPQIKEKNNLGKV